VRIAAVLNAFDIPNPGGVQESARVALEGLRAKFDVVPIFINVEGRAGWIGALKSALRTRGTFDACLYWHCDFLRLMPFMPRSKSFLFLHGTEVWHKRGPVTQRMMKQCDVVLSNTSFTLQQALSANPGLRGLTSRVVHLGLGVPAPATPELPRRPVAISIGRLHPDERYKGHDELIAAWPLVLRQMPDAQLWIVGDGALRTELEDAVRQKGLSDSIRFFGRVSEAEKAQLLDKSSCMLMPSTGEGFGLVYLEAMRIGRPCLTGMDGGREVVNAPEAGLSVSSRSPEEVAATTIRLLSADADWRSRTRARYDAHFTARHFQERLCASFT